MRITVRHRYLILVGLATLLSLHSVLLWAQPTPSGQSAAVAGRPSLAKIQEGLAFCEDYERYGEVVALTRILLDQYPKDDLSKEDRGLYIRCLMVGYWLLHEVADNVDAEQQTQNVVKRLMELAPSEKGQTFRHLDHFIRTFRDSDLGRAQEHMDLLRVAVQDNLGANPELLVRVYRLFANYERQKGDKQAHDLWLAKWADTVRKAPSNLRKEHVALLIYEGDLAYHHARDFGTASTKYSESLRLCVDLYGADHPRTAESHTLCGLASYGRGFPEAAVASFKEAIRIYKQHPDWYAERIERLNAHVLQIGERAK